MRCRRVGKGNNGARRSGTRQVLGGSCRLQDRSTECTPAPALATGREQQQFSANYARTEVKWSMRWPGSDSKPSYSLSLNDHTNITTSEPMGGGDGAYYPRSRWMQPPSAYVSTPAGVISILRRKRWGYHISCVVVENSSGENDSIVNRYYCYIPCFQQV